MFQFCLSNVCGQMSCTHEHKKSIKKLYQINNDTGKCQTSKIFFANPNTTSKSCPLEYPIWYHHTCSSQWNFPQFFTVWIYASSNKTSSPFHKKDAVAFKVQTHKLTNAWLSMVQKIAKIFQIYKATDKSLWRATALVSIKRLTLQRNLNVRVGFPSKE